jgi:hypothetical protein
MDEDVYFTDNQIESENRIFEIEENKKIENMINASFNKGYLSEIEKMYENEFNLGYEKGKNYSIKFGKILGKIESILFYDELNNILNENDKIELINLNNEIENFNNKIDEEILLNYKNKINEIINKNNLI